MPARDLSPILLLTAGLRRAARHPKLVALHYLAALLPALALLRVPSAALHEALDHSLFARRLLQGPPGDSLLGVTRDLTTGHGSPMEGLLPLLPVVFALMVLLHILLAAGSVEVLLERPPVAGEVHPFPRGVARHGWVFLRSAFAFALALIVPLGLAGAGLVVAARIFRQAADGRPAMLGAGAAVALAFLLFAWLDLAYDLSRAAAAQHGGRHALASLRRALAGLFRRPRLVFLLYPAFTALLLAPHTLYALLPRPPASGGGLLALLAVQQLLLMLRAYLRLAVWGTEITAYEALGRPPWSGADTSRGEV